MKLFSGASSYISPLSKKLRRIYQSEQTRQSATGTALTLAQPLPMQMRAELKELRRGMAELPAEFYTFIQPVVQRKRPLLIQQLSQGAAVRPLAPLSQASSATDVFGHARAQQLGELLTEAEKEERNKRMRQADRNVAIAVATMGLSIAGNFYWPLRVLSLPGFLYLFSRSLQKTWQLIQQRRVGVPMIATVVNLGMLLFGYFGIGSLGLLIQQLSDKLVATVVDDSRNKMINIFRQVPKTAWLVLEEGEVQVPLTQVEAGQLIAIYAGEIIPVDGVVVAGMATVDQQLLTGEARPVDKGVGEPVFAATLVIAGHIQVAVEKAGESTAVAQIGAMLNQTIEYKSSIELRAEALGDKTVIPTMIAGAATFALVGPMGALTLMSAHFRRAMALFGPLSMMTYLNLASQRGTLIKDGRSLDLLSQVDTLVFDKTGTLTHEQPMVGVIHVYPPLASSDPIAKQAAEHHLLRLAAAAEQRQSHPIARAIQTAASVRGLVLPEIQEAAYQMGYGLTVHIEGQVVRVGSTRLMQSSGLAIPAVLAQIEEEAHLQGHTLIMVACNDAVIGALELIPSVRPEVKAMIQTLRQHYNIKSTYIISGDHVEPTRRLAAELGIDHYFAETLPEQKAELIARLCEEGRFVCYVGDGINDAIALKKAHVSISLQGASSVAMDTAQVILVNGNLQTLPELFEFAREFRANTDQTFAILVGTTLFGMGGALFLHFTLIHTTVLGVISLIAGLSNSLRPLSKYQLYKAD